MMLHRPGIYACNNPLCFYRGRIDHYAEMVPRCVVCARPLSEDVAASIAAGIQEWRRLER